VVDLERDDATFGLERPGAVVLVGIVGATKVVEGRDGLDDAVSGLLAEGRDARRYDGYV